MLSRLSSQCLFYNIYVYIYIYIYSPKQIYFHLSYNFRHFMIFAVMYNSTGYEYIVQNDKFLSVIFIYCFNFTIYIYIYIYRPKQIYFHLSYNFRHFMISACIIAQDMSTLYKTISFQVLFLYIVLILHFIYIYIYIYI